VLLVLLVLSLQVTQEAEPPLPAFYRHISKGAWPFSSRDHGWPISDCTSEGFKAALGIAALGRTSVLSGPQVRMGVGAVWCVSAEMC
jgi:squalene cyclase